MTALKNTITKQDLEIIQKVYSGINQNDPESVLQLLHSIIVRNEFEDSPKGSTFRGHAELKQNLTSGRSNWAEGACEPIEFFVEGNKIVVDVHVKVRLKNETKWIDTHSTDGFLIKDGQVAEFHSFTTKQKAFEWARL